MQQYNLNKVIVVVEVPQDATEVHVTKLDHYDPDDYLYLSYQDGTGIEHYIKLDTGVWILVTLSNDMNEDIAKGLVEFIQLRGSMEIGFKHYGLSNEITEYFHCKSALESIRTWEKQNNLITSNQIEFVDELGIDLEQLERYREAQQQVVNIAYLIKG